MPTIQAKFAGARVTAGDDVIANAKTVSIKPIRKRYTEFVTVHRQYRALHDHALAAESREHDHYDTVAELDVDQDEGLDALASALAGEGLPRTNPFKPFGFAAPSDLKAAGDETEARAALKLATAVRKRKKLSRATLAALKRVEKTARAVLAAVRNRAPLAKTRHAAVSTRDALAQRWANAFAALKRAARAAEDDGHRGLYDALFVKPAAAVKRKARGKKNAPAGAAAAATATTA